MTLLLDERTKTLVVGRFDPEALAVIGAEYGLDIVQASIELEPHLIRGED